MSMKYWLMVGSAVFLLLSCTSGSPLSGEGEGVQQVVPGVLNTVKVGSEFEIQLMGNPTTGYCWTVDKQSSLKHVKLVSEKQVVKKQPRGMVGGPAHPFVFVFKAVSPGKEKVVLVYKRSWEKKAPIESREFQVEVTE